MLGAAVLIVRTSAEAQVVCFDTAPTLHTVEATAGARSAADQCANPHQLSANLPAQMATRKEFADPAPAATGHE
jgi:hypothetical protein